MTTSVRRPALITVLAVLVVIGGVLALVTGIIALSVSGIALVGLIPILIGIAYLAVAKGLLDGNPTARIVVAVIAAIQLVMAVLSLSGDGTGAQRSSAIGSLVFPVLILVVLFLPASNAFFGRRR